MANKINRQNEGPRRWLISFLAKEVLVLVLGISFCVSVNGASMLYLQSYEAWRKHLDDRWGYLLQEEQLDESRQAAVWVGEFGTATDSEWWKFMTRYLSERPVAGWAYWPLNGEKRPGEPEYFSIWEDDMRTVRHPWKLQDLQKTPSRVGPDRSPRRTALTAMERAEEDPWSDCAGVREVLHREPGGPVGPLLKYQEYMGLQEFESIKATVAKEAIPMRRYQMSDYRPGQVEEATKEEAPVEEAVPGQPESEGRPPSEGGKPTPSAPRSSPPKPDALQVWLAAKERALESPRKPIVMPSPRGTAARAAGKQIVQPERGVALESIAPGETPRLQAALDETVAVGERWL
eukprot:g1628.t1